MAAIAQILVALDKNVRAPEKCEMRTGMSPELERLLAALYERDTCKPKDRGRCERSARRLVEDALRQVPDTSRSQFLEAISHRYHEFKRVRRKQFPTIPPKA